MKSGISHSRVLIYYYMKKRKTKNVELAKDIVSNSHLSNLLHGRFHMSKELLSLLAKKLEIPENLIMLPNELNLKLEKNIAQSFFNIPKLRRIIAFPYDNLIDDAHNISFDQLIILKFWENLHFFSTHQDQKLQKSIIDNALLLFITNEHLAEFIWTSEERINIKNIFLAFYYTGTSEFKKAKKYYSKTSISFQESYVGINLRLMCNNLSDYLENNQYETPVFSQFDDLCTKQADFISDFNKVLLSMTFISANNEASSYFKEGIFNYLCKIINTIMTKNYYNSICLIEDFRKKFPSFLVILLDLVLAYCYIKVNDFSIAKQLIESIETTYLLFPFYKGIHEFVNGLLEKHDRNFHRFEFQLKESFNYFKTTNCIFILANIQEELGNYYFESHQYKKAAISYQEGASYYSRRYSNE